MIIPAFIFVLQIARTVFCPIYSIHKYLIKDSLTGNKLIPTKTVFYPCKSFRENGILFSKYSKAKPAEEKCLIFFKPQIKK